MSEWPADEVSVERARAALSRLAPTAKVVVASDHDVDALAGADVFVRALRRQMIDPRWLVARRGESAVGLRARIEASGASAGNAENGPDLAIVVGLGTGPVPARVPTIVIEHRPCPPVGILVDAPGGWDHAPDDSTAQYRAGRAAGGNLCRRAFFELLARLGFEVEHIDAWNGLGSES